LSNFAKTATSLMKCVQNNCMILQEVMKLHHQNTWLCFK